MQSWKPFNAQNLMHHILGIVNDSNGSQTVLIANGNSLWRYGLQSSVFFARILYFCRAADVSVVCSSFSRSILQVQILNLVGSNDVVRRYI